MNPEIEISEAKEDDAEAIRDLAVRIWHASYPGIITREQIDYMLGWMYAPDRIRSEIRDEEIVYLRVDQTSEMVALAAFGPGVREGEVFIHKLYVDTPWQGRGIGGAVIREIEGRVRAGGGGRISLRVNRNNLQAIGAYEKNGFRRYRKVCSDIGGGFVMDDFEMVKVIDR